MLEQLKLNNLALSVQAEVDFTPGMICITGETGAGKSLVVDALALALGAKADASMVRQGQKQLEVEALFSLKYNTKAKACLESFGFAPNASASIPNSSSLSVANNNEFSVHYGVAPDGQASGLVNSAHATVTELAAGTVESDNDEELVLRRIVSAEGKSKAYINGHMATLSQLRELSESLVAIHGQHASVKLIDEKNQLEIIDNYGKLKDLVGEVNELYREYTTKRSKLISLSETQKQGVALYKQDRYSLEALKKLDLHAGDYEELEAMFDRAMNQANFSYALASVHGVIEGSDSNILSILRERENELDKFKHLEPNIVKMMEHLEDAILHLSACSDLAMELSAQNFSMSTTELEARMSKVHEMARRFSCAPKDLYLMTDSLKAKVQEFLGLKEQITQLTEEVKQLREIYEEKAMQLTCERQIAAHELAERIGTKITSLALPDARFDIRLTRDEESKPKLNGRDNACFMFSANLGQELRPLADVASGGELSRLALTIEVLTASVKSTPTLIFDEVDTGISGRTASAVGTLLKELGHFVQVITVTHLPQVAAKANTQFVVAKFNEAGQVNSTISVLDSEGRIEEISRMIGGSVITDTTRKSACELLSD